MSPFRASAALTERWEHFDLAVADGVVTLTFNRPERLNALTFDAYADLLPMTPRLATQRRAQARCRESWPRSGCCCASVIFGSLYCARR